MKFSLKQLLFADEVCYPSDFQKLMEKHTKGTSFETGWQIFCLDFKRCDNNLLVYLKKHWTRDGLDKYGFIMENIISELIGDYE